MSDKQDRILAPWVSKLTQGGIPASLLSSPDEGIPPVILDNFADFLEVVGGDTSTSPKAVMRKEAFEDYLHYCMTQSAFITPEEYLGIESPDEEVVAPLQGASPTIMGTAVSFEQPIDFQPPLAPVSKASPLDEYLEAVSQKVNVTSEDIDDDYEEPSEEDEDFDIDDDYEEPSEEDEDFDIDDDYEEPSEEDEDFDIDDPSDDEEDDIDDDYEDEDDIDDDYEEPSEEDDIDDDYEEPSEEDDIDDDYEEPSEDEEDEDFDIDDDYEEPSEEDDEDFDVDDDYEEDFDEDGDFGDEDDPEALSKTFDESFDPNDGFGSTLGMSSADQRVPLAVIPEIKHQVEAMGDSLVGLYDKFSKIKKG